MKRLHIHIAVKNLQESIQFYSTVFGTAPTKTKADYAQWLLEDPLINFAISARGRVPGLDHLGIQVEREEELHEVRSRINQAELKTYDEGETTCCYSKADKTWVIDPSGIAWEAYRKMEDAELFGKEQKITPAQNPSCCSPKQP